MREVFVVSDNILSPLGSTTAENFERLKKGSSGIRKHERPLMNEKPFFASLFAEKDLSSTESITRFEKAIIDSIDDA
jgi:3-oxoacyl-[acyl-carrier-protein] synthase I